MEEISVEIGRNPIIFATRTEPKKLTAIRVNLTIGPTWQIDPGFRRITIRRAL